MLIGPGVGAVDALGATLALAGAVAYVAFVLAGDYLAVGTDPLVLAALMGTGAMPTFIVYGLITDGLSLDFQASGWIWIVGVAIVSLVAFTTFFAGLERVGPVADRAALDQRAGHDHRRERDHLRHRAGRRSRCSAARS